MERQGIKQEPKIIRTAKRILAGAITEATYNYIKAQGYKGTKKKNPKNDLSITVKRNLVRNNI